MTPNPTKEQMQELLRPRFGDVEIVCESPVFHGSQSMVPLGFIGVLYVYADETGKKFAVGVPFDARLMTQEEAA